MFEGRGRTKAGLDRSKRHSLATTAASTAAIAAAAACAIEARGGERKREASLAGIVSCPPGLNYSPSIWF